MRRMFDKEEIADIAGGGGIGELKSIDFPYGKETVTYDTTDGITLDAMARLTHGNNNDNTDVRTTLSVPLIASDGIVIDADAANTKAVIKVDSSKVPYYPSNVGNAKVLVRYGNIWDSLAYSASVVNNSIVSRTSSGTIKTAEPTENNDCATKSYVDTAIAGVGGGNNTTIICTNDNYPAYTYTFTANKAVKIDYILKAQGITNQATLSVILNGAVPMTIYSDKVAAGSGQMISGTIYYFDGHNSNYPTSGGANTAAGPAFLSSCTSDNGTELVQGAGADYTSITFNADVTGPTGSSVFGVIHITHLT